MGIKSIFQGDIFSLSVAITKTIQVSKGIEATINIMDVKDAVYVAQIHTENEIIVKRLVVSK